MYVYIYMYMCVCVLVYLLTPLIWLCVDVHTGLMPWIGMWVGCLRVCCGTCVCAYVLFTCKYTFTRIPVQIKDIKPVQAPTGNKQDALGVHSRTFQKVCVCMGACSCTLCCMCIVVYVCCTWCVLSVQCAIRHTYGSERHICIHTIGTGACSQRMIVCV